MKQIWLLLSAVITVAALSACTDAGGGKPTPTTVTPTTTVLTTAATTTLASADRTTVPTSTLSSTSAVITRERALEIALAKAGLTADQVRDIDVELDRDGGVLHYDVDFETAKTEYDCEINAATGAVLRFETEPND